MSKLLDQINSHQDLRALAQGELRQLSVEMRSFLIDTILENGGHFAANLGVVELTLALHHQLNLPDDVLVWDVGHQAYAHKALTGRKNEIKHIRKTNGISGFPSIAESEYDAFGTGHSSTSISSVLGMAQASALAGKTNRHIAVIGDGALTAGQAYEALNHLAQTELDVLVIVNDNQMSIDDNNGNIARILHDKTKARSFFETLGFNYDFCANGNSMEAIYTALATSLAAKKPRVLHIKTKKGFGYHEAENDGIRWHATESMVKVLPDIAPKSKLPKYQEVAGKTVVELAAMDEKVVVVTPAMPTGSGLKEFEAKYPDRFFDVGIAEQHAVTFSAGLAKQGYRVFCFIYSTFLQRAYDQLIHDVCIQSLPVVFCIDRAGLVGGDGATHHGVFDISYLKPIPNIDIIAPSSVLQMRNAFFTGMQRINGPTAIRYPRGRGEVENYQSTLNSLDRGKSILIQEGKKLAIITIGNCLNEVKKAISGLNAVENSITVLDMVYIKPLDEEKLKNIFSSHLQILTIENGSIKGGIGEQLASLSNSWGMDCSFNTLGIGDQFVEHGSTADLSRLNGIDAASIRDIVLKLLEQ